MYIDNKQILGLLPMSECIEVMKELFLLDFDKEVINPLRSKMLLNNPENGLMGMMPAYIKPYGVMGIKVLSVFPNNYKEGLSSHQGILHLFETKTGQLLSSFDADEITAIRTAAVSAVATDILAVENAKNLCILGSGKQARKHIEAILLVRPIQRITLWSKNQENAEKLKLELEKLYSLSIEVFASVEQSVQDADIICTVTASRNPILDNHYLQSHVHINAVGACTPDSSELSTAIIKNSKIYVDSYESATHESGALISSAIEEGCKPEDFIEHSISEIMRNRKSIDPSSKTIFKSLGLAVEDVACGHYLHNKLAKNVT